MDHNKNPELSRGLSVARIIVSALVGAVVLFGIVVAVVINPDPPAQGGDAMISIVMAVVGLSLIVPRLIVPGMVVSSACRSIARGNWPPPGSRSGPGWTPPSTDEGKLAQVFLSKTIIASALMEGAAFSNVVAYLLEGQWYSMVLAAVFALGILIGFPTNRGFAAWLDQHLRIVKQSRDMPDMH